MANDVYALTPIHRINVRSARQKHLVAFFASGSKICLVRKAFAKQAGWKRTPVRQLITIAGGEAKVWSSMQYWVPLRSGY